MVGVVSANLMFGLSPLFMSEHPRGGISQVFSEFVATFELLTVVLFCGRYRPTAVAYSVAAYITAAYWFTSSTSFANPAVTLARAFTDTFAGIRVADVPAFVVAQLSGAFSALVAFRAIANIKLLWKVTTRRGRRNPHEEASVVLMHRKLCPKPDG
jgi:glycerol uptake facilitator-like aquaporin